MWLAAMPIPPSEAAGWNVCYFLPLSDLFIHLYTSWLLPRLLEENSSGAFSNLYLPPKKKKEKKKTKPQLEIVIVINPKQVFQERAHFFYW